MFRCAAYLFLLFLTFTTASASEKANNNDSTLHFLKLTHDFGNVEISNGAVFWNFEYVNQSDSTVVFIGASSTCGCTIPEYSHDPIKPGERGVVKVTYNPYGRPEGEFEKTVKIRTSGNPEVINLTVKGKAEQKIKIWY